MRPRQLGLVAITSVVLLTRSSLATAADQAPRVVTVQGKAEVHVVPDRVDIGLSVISKDYRPQKAYEENVEKAKALLASVEASGIPKADVQTTRVDMRAIYRNHEREFDGYEARQSFSVTLQDPSRYEELLLKLIASGVNRLDYVSFRTEEPRQHKDEARRLAVRAAREKAAALAAELGAELGPVHSISEEADGGGWGRQSWVETNAAYNMGGESAELEDVALGKITISARVTVQFDLRPKTDEMQ